MIILDKNGATPLYLVFHPIEYKERHKYKDEKNIPKALLCWQDIDAGTPRDPKKPGRNDVLVQIGQALLQGKEIKGFKGIGSAINPVFSWRSFCS